MNEGLPERSNDGRKFVDEDNRDYFLIGSMVHRGYTIRRDHLSLAGLEIMPWASIEREGDRYYVKIQSPRSRIPEVIRLKRAD